MPGFTTHYLFGQQTYQLLPSSELKQTIRRYHKVYALGLQGPDIFFYDFLSPVTRKRKPGSIAHTNETSAFLKSLLESPKIFLTKKEKQIALAYVFGFIGHYLLDTVCHPYIYAMTHYNNDKEKGYLGRHIRLETDIDTSLLWHYQRRRPSNFQQHKCIALSKEELHVISTVLYSAFSKTYPRLGLRRYRITQAVRAMQKATKFLYDPTGYKKTMIRRIESFIPGYPVLSPLIPNDKLIFHLDPCNTRHSSWQNPWNEAQESKESFFDLFEKAQTQYLRVFKDAAVFLSDEKTMQEEANAISLLLSHLGNRSYHSGLPSASNLL